MSVFASLLFSLVIPISRNPLDQTVTASVRAMPATKAIAELAKQTGLPLTAMPTVKDDILIIRVHDVPLQELMDKIASTIHAGWEKDGEGYRLLRTEAMRRQEVEADIAYETQLFAKGIEGKRKALADMGVLDEKKANYIVTRLKAIHDRSDPSGGLTGNEWRSTQEVTDQSPANRAILRICAALNPEDLAKLPIDKRIVYSNLPNQMQLRIPANLTPILNDFKREVALMVDANQKIMGERQSNWSFGDQSLYGRSPGTPTKVLLSFTKNPTYGMVQLQLQIANEKGKIMGSAYTSFSRDYEAYSKEIGELTKQGEKEEAIKLSPESEAVQKKWMDLMRSTGGPPSDPLPSDVLQKVLKPEDYDPLSYGATDACFGLAQLKNLNVVAAPSDFFIANILMASTMKPSTLLYALNQPEIGGKIENGWLTISPPLQSDSRGARLDRPSLGNLLRAANKRGKVGLDDMAAFALKNESEMSSWMAMLFLTAIGQGENRNQGWNWAALRFYGTLTANQLRALQAKQPVSFRTLNPQQQSMIHKMVFDSQYSNLNMTPEYQATGLQQEDYDSFYGGLGREPTEAMPNGVPFDGSFTADFQRDSVVFLGNVDGNPQWMANRAYTPTELAWEVYQREHKDLFPWINEGNQGQVKFDKLRIGERLMINMNFKFTKMVGMNQSLQDNTYGSGQEFSIANLPDEFKKAYDAAYKQQVEQYKDVKPGQFDYGGGTGRTNIPPDR